MITPLHAGETLDCSGLEHLVEHILAGGVHGLFLLGTTGEGPSLPYALRRDLIRRVCDLVRGRVPVLVGITDTVPDESLALARVAADHGSAAVVLAPPFYFPVSQGELWGYIERMAQALPLPFYLYNLPSLTKVTIGEEVVRRSLSLPNCLGLKDSSGDMNYFKRMQHVLGGEVRRSLFMGPEELLVDGLLAGGDGGVSGGANVWPRLYVDIFERAECGDWIGARAAQARVLAVSRKIYSIGGYGSTVIKALKAVLGIMGVCDAALAAPHLKMDESEVAVLKQALAQLGLKA